MKKTGYLTICVMLLLSIFKVDVAHAITENWREFHSINGSCKISFPSIPKHLNEKFQLPKSKATVTYDAYISTKESRTVYMMLIASYPHKIATHQEEASLESFINGLVQKGGKIIFADFIKDSKATAMEFFIHNNDVFFKGKVIMKNNKLYLIAVESIVDNYEEKLYHQFIESFSFL